MGGECGGGDGGQESTERGDSCAGIAVGVVLAGRASGGSEEEGGTENGTETGAGGRCIGQEAFPVRDLGELVYTRRGFGPFRVVSFVQMSRIHPNWKL